ncbi:hypothetical protein CB0940_04071 [Cercospora beticola]|uniref:Uncharacterized protein n=1 Tax=Cercospora beticola TaxID=122368 RepID=A0A2G5HM41_CERBT|nr:hypothetical protein CB0940_04071 [Cercospora beticola]PIA93626.1 hypothetical protein CB0940_04071 [Cercospora beticola]
MVLSRCKEQESEAWYKIFAVPEIETWTLGHCYSTFPLEPEAVTYTLPQTLTSASTTNQQDNREIEHAKARLERAFRLAMSEFTLSPRRLQRCPNLWYGIGSAGFGSKNSSWSIPSLTADLRQMRTQCILCLLASAQYASAAAALLHYPARQCHHTSYTAANMRAKDYGFDGLSSASFAEGLMLPRQSFGQRQKLTSSSLLH